MDAHESVHQPGVHCVSCCSDLNCQVPQCVEFIAEAEAEARAIGLWAVGA